MKLRRIQIANSTPESPTTPALKPVVVVDSAAGHLALLAADLEPHGFLANRAESTARAGELADSALPISMVLIDAGRAADGREISAMQALRQRHPLLPVVVVSAPGYVVSRALPIGTTSAVADAAELSRLSQILLAEDMYPKALRDLLKDAAGTVLRTIDPELSAQEPVLRANQYPLGPICMGIHFVGLNIAGHIAVASSTDDLRRLRASLLGIDLSPSPTQLRDMASELTNQILGRFKASFAHGGFAIGLPSVLTHEAIIMRHAASLVITFATANTQLVVELCLDRIALSRLELVDVPEVVSDPGEVTFL